MTTPTKLEEPASYQIKIKFTENGVITEKEFIDIK